MARRPSDRTGARGRGRPRSEQAHAAILDAAIALIREVGYDAVAMEAIADRAGVGKATVYRWWASKELLVTEAIGRIVSTITAPDTGCLESDVLALMRATMARYRDPATAALLSGLVAAMARSERVADAVRSGFVARWRDVMRAVLWRAVARGELRADADVEVALDLLSGPPFYRYLLLGVPIDERFTHAVVVVVLRGLAPEDGASRGHVAPGGAAR
jgi:AcrR family transcriptional regulator